MKELRAKVKQTARKAEEDDGDYHFSEKAFKKFCALLQSYQQEITLQKVREAIIGKDTDQYG